MVSKGIGVTVKKATASEKKLKSKKKTVSKKASTKKISSKKVLPAKNQEIENVEVESKQVELQPAPLFPEETVKEEQVIIEAKDPVSPPKKLTHKHQNKTNLQDKVASSPSIENELVEDTEETFNSFELKLSKSLVRKLQQKSQQEAVTMEELMIELISEGLVLRAWEIIERKNAMRGGNPQQQQNKFANNNIKQNGRNNNFRSNNKNRPHNNNNNNNNNRRSMSYNSIMGEKDNSNFLEYVRSQEKNFNR